MVKRLLLSILLLSALTTDGMMNFSQCLLLYYKYNVGNIELSDILTSSKEQGFESMPFNSELSKAEKIIKSRSEKNYIASSDNDCYDICGRSYSFDLSAYDNYLYNIEQPFCVYKSLRLVNSSGVSPPYNV